MFRAEERGESLELGEVEENSIREDFSMRSPVEADKEASSFCYLLINPSKISQTEGHTFREFIAAIFYVGQGKRSRPLKHMRIPAKHRNNTGIKVFFEGPHYNAKILYTVADLQDQTGVL